MTTKDLFSAYEHAALLVARHGEKCPAVLSAFSRLERAIDEHNNKMAVMDRAKAVLAKSKAAGVSSGL